MIFWRSARFRALGYVRPTVRVRRGTAAYHVSTRDRVLGRHVYVHGDFEASILRRAYYLLDDLRLASMDRGLLVDVGANIGTTCIQALTDRLATGAVAIEPEPHNFDLLTRNISENGLDDAIRPVHAALSDTRGSAELELSAHNFGDHRLRVSASRGLPGAFAEDLRNVLDVPITTFDALVADGAIDLRRLGLAWLDTQGHEGHVLGGATTLRHSEVPVVIEYWPYGLERAGALNTLEGIVRGDYRWFMDLRQPGASRRSTAEVSRLRESIPSPYFTDLLLWKG